MMKKNMEGSECPTLDMQATSEAHADRYKGKGQGKKNDKKVQNKEKKEANAQ